MVKEPDTYYLNSKIAELIQSCPYTTDFFSTMALPLKDTSMTLEAYFQSLDTVFLESMGIDRAEICERFSLFMQHMEHIEKGVQFNVKSVTILGGRDKSGEPEQMEFTMKAGDIVCLVGPTGSGKSRLLADIEWLAQRDTPTGRQILINGNTPPEEWRFSTEHKMVAQLSQNMNFIMDISVDEFVRMHAESRMVKGIDEKVESIIHQANMLAGEKFSPDTPVTALSGGQSRALMIADAAFLSTSPIVLIDEIENAGIDRRLALELLVKKEKIVLMATHDPILALMGDRRLITKNGAVYKVLETTKEEKEKLKELQELDYLLMSYRNKLRRGERI